MRQPARRSKGRQEAARQAASGSARRAAASALATHLCHSQSIPCTHRIDCSQRSQLPFPPPAQRARPLHILYLEHWTRRRLDWLRGSAWASAQMAPLHRRHTCTESRQRERHAPRERIRRGGSCGTGRSGVRRCCSARAPCRCSAAGSRTVCDATSGCRVHDTLGIEQP